MRFRVEYRDADGNVGHGFTDVAEGPMVQVRAEVQFIKAAEAEGRKLWCTWSCRESASERHAEPLHEFEPTWCARCSTISREQTQ